MFLSSYTKNNYMSIGEVVPITIKLPQKLSSGLLEKDIEKILSLMTHNLHWIG
jgi:hypothetical protein